MDTQDRAQGQADLAVDAFIFLDGKAPQVVVRDAVNRIDLSRTGVFARAATDTGLVDIEITFNWFGHRA